MTLLLAAIYTGSEDGNTQQMFMASFDDGDADCSGCTSARSRYDGAWAFVFNGLTSVRRDPTTSFLTTTTLIYAIGAGITAAAGTRLALQ